MPDEVAIARKLREVENLASQLAHAVLNKQPMTAEELAKRVLALTDAV